MRRLHVHVAPSCHLQQLNSTTAYMYFFNGNSPSFTLILLSLPKLCIFHTNVAVPDATASA